MKPERRSPERAQFVLGPEPEVIVEFRDPYTPARGWAVIDTVDSPAAFGGVRMDPGVTVIELARLARQTTVRYALAQIGLSGARLGLAWPPTAPDAADVLGRFLARLRPLLHGSLSLGPDDNVDAALLDRVLAARDLPWRMNAIQRAQGWPSTRWASYQHLLDESIEGARLRDLHVEYSVATAATALTDFLLKGTRSIGVLGSGELAVRLAQLLGRMGAPLLAVGSSDGGLYCPKGLAPELLGPAARGDLPSGADHVYVTSDELHRLPLDVLIVCSADEPIDVDNVGRVRARVVVEAVSGAVSRNAEKVLLGGGAAVLPSFAASMGAVFVTDAALSGKVDSARGALDHLVEQVRTTTLEMARLSVVLRIPLREAGVRLASHRAQGILGRDGTGGGGG